MILFVGLLRHFVPRNDDYGRFGEFSF